MKYFVPTIKVIWLSLSILILYFTLHRLSELNSMRNVSELISIMSYGMILISFPTGVVFIIVQFFLYLALDIVYINTTNKYLTAIVVWFIFLLAGYIQWFYLMNKIVKK